MANTELDWGVTYVSEDGDQAFLSIPGNKVISWSNTGWHIQDPVPGMKLAADLPTGVLVMTWATTNGCMDDARERFFTPHVYRDLTKRPYKTWRNGGVLSESGEPEDQMESWILFRVHKLAIRLNED